MPDFELYPCDHGTYSLKDRSLAESMHSRIGPYREAQILYIEQSRLFERLSTPSSQPLVIYDVGMGIAANAISAIDCYESGPKLRPVQIYSFENEPSGLRTAIASPDHFPYLKSHLNKVEQLLSESKKWMSNDRQFVWSWIEEDFLSCSFPPEKPDLIFFDFYSPKVNPALWSAEIFKRFLKHSKSNTTLYTYCANSSVRKSLIEAGFKVGVGVGTSLKRESTIACLEDREVNQPYKKNSWSLFAESENH